MARKCDEAGLPLLSVWAKDVIVMDDVEIAEGALVSPYVTFTSNIKVGRCFHANLYSYVEHDCDRRLCHLRAGGALQRQYSDRRSRLYRLGRGHPPKSDDRRGRRRRHGRDRDQGCSSRRNRGRQPRPHSREKLTCSTPPSRPGQVSRRKKRMPFPPSCCPTASTIGLARNAAPLSGSSPPGRRATMPSRSPTVRSEEHTSEL